MKIFIFLSIYFLVSLSTSSRSYHLKGVARITKKNPNEMHNTNHESSENGTVIPSSIKNHFSEHYGLNLNGTTRTLENSQKETLSNSRLAEKISNNKTETKIGSKEKWTSLRMKTSEKPSYLRDFPRHSKRESLDHSIKHKEKDWDKLPSKENRLNRFDVVMVDIQPMYSELRNKQRLNSYTPPLSHHAPLSTSTSIMDLFFGLNSFPPTLLKEPVEIDNDFYFQEGLFSPSWNRLVSYGHAVNPDYVQEQNDYQNRKNVNIGKMSDGNMHCTCAERNNFVIN